MGKISEASAEASQKAAAGVAESAEAHPGHEQAHGDACACGHCHDHEHEHEHHHEHEAAPVDRVLGTAPDFAYHVLGIDCPHCAKSCENAVRTLQTVEDARLVYATATLEVVKKPEATSRECRREVLETVRSCGQDLELSDEEREELEAQRSWWETNRQKVLLGSSGILLGVGLVAEHLLSNVAVAGVAYVVAAICGLVFILPMAVASLRRKTADMNVLMSIAVIGGILLGAGGLCRAYTKAAKDALDDAGISELRPWSVLRLDCPYALFERVKLETDKRGGLVRDADYGAQIALTILLPQPEEAEFRKALQELSAGSLAPETTGTELRGVRIR